MFFFVRSWMKLLDCCKVVFNIRARITIISFMSWLFNKNLTFLIIYKNVRYNFGSKKFVGRTNFLGWTSFCFEHNFYLKNSAKIIQFFSKIIKSDFRPENRKKFVRMASLLVLSILVLNRTIHIIAYQQIFGPSIWLGSHQLF